MAVLVLAPFARDTELTCEFLKSAGIDAWSCAGIEELCETLGEASGAVLVMEEALAGDALSRLLSALGAQPAWSDLQVLVIVGAHHKPDDAPIRHLTESLGNVTLITRPAHPVTLLSCVRSALLARARQYELRDALGSDEGCYRQLVETSLKHAFVTLFQQDRELRYTRVHPGFFGRAAEEVIGQRDADLLPRREEGEALEVFKREVLASGGGEQRCFRVVLNGGPRHFDIRADPLYDERGERVGLAGVAVDVTEHVELQERLRRHTDQLARMDQRKNDFLAQLAHELRNPLAPIHNAVHVLRIQPDPPDPAHVKWAIDVIARQVQHLARLVDDLLDVARVTHGGITLRREIIEIGRALAQAIEAVRPLTTARKQVLTYSPPVEPLRVCADPTRLLQIVSNLLNNAARYTPPGGHIALSARPEDDAAVISVKDDGIGIPPEAVERIFEPFHQGARPPDTAQTGLGLGLTLVQHLVGLHEGSVAARSEGAGKGSEFTVRLPLAPPPREVAPAEPAKETAWRLLVVDDDPDVAQSFALLLRVMGYRVQTANDGASGLEMAASFHPHVAFIDIGLPNMDGYELARALRAANPDPALRLVALTGYTQEEVRRRAAAAGFDAHLLKPASTETIERLLESFRSSA